MESPKKRLIIILLLAVGIVGGSFYNFWQRSSNNTLSAEPVGEVVVYVSGAVNKPGVFSIAATARVLDAVTVAGGLTPQGDVSKVNMAQPVKDGMQIYVPSKEINSDKAANVVAPGNSLNSGKVSLNTATKEALDTLPGVGPALAEKIIEYRQTHGGFKDIEEVRKVKGISEKKYEKLKDKLAL